MATQSEPPGPIRSLHALFAVAHAMEEAAARQYEFFAQQMRGQAREALAQTFERVAAEERTHVANVDAWSRSKVGEAPRQALLPWSPPPTFDDADAAEMNSARLTPYGALATAVGNEERAFAFWTYVAAHAETDEIRSAAETMARAELEHAALFRRERRAAFHAERRGSADSPAMVELGLDAAEARLATAIENVARQHGEVDSAQLRRILVETETMAREVDRGATIRIASDSGPLEIAEALVDGYLDGAATCDTDKSLIRAQSFAARAILRLSALKRAIAPS